MFNKFDYFLNYVEYIKQLSAIFQERVIPKLVILTAVCSSSLASNLGRPL